MNIELKKFGTTLISRQTGREAFSALQPFLKDVKEGEIIEVDFDGVLTFSPSWGDEFLTPLLNTYGEKIILKNTSNPSVQATLEILEKTIGKNFSKKE
ncbi:MAG: STAS-like domain-containing protein [Patescibacteria group bacterium]